MNLISYFIKGCTKTPFKLKQTCIFHLPDYVSVYKLLIPSSMKVLKGKTIYKTNELLGNIQYVSVTGA